MIEYLKIAFVTLSVISLIIATWLAFQSVVLPYFDYYIDDSDAGVLIAGFLLWPLTIPLLLIVA